MTACARRAVAVAAVAVLVAGLTAVGGLRALDAVAALEPDHDHAVPYALARPLWTDVIARRGAAQAVASMPGAAGRERGQAALRIIRREQLHGVLRGVLGLRPARVVQLGELQDRGRTIGATALLALPVARRDVHATVPGGIIASATGPRVARVRVTAPVLRDVLVDVDLRSGQIVAVEPGPASRTSAWSAAWPPTPIAAVAAAPSAPAFVRLSPHGPSFAPYDGTPALGPAGRDWPVSLIFAGHATVGKVKRALRAVGFTHRGERRWLAYGGPGGAVRFDSDAGVKTATDADSTDVHVRLYAPPGTDHFTDPRFGSVVVATAHLDRGEGSATPPRLFGFSEEAELRVAETVAHRLGWRVQRDRVALGNAEPFRRDLAAPDHLWWNDGRATVISVP
jgi:hypothetical protein